MNISNLYTDIQQLLLHPATYWLQMFRKTYTFRPFLRNYLLPLTSILSILVIGIHLFQRPIIQAIEFGIVNFITNLGSFWITFLLTKEYMCHKLDYEEKEIIPLIGYSNAIFIIFYSIGHACGTLFIGQLFILLSFSFLRTLYWGIKQSKN